MYRSSAAPCFTVLRVPAHANLQGQQLSGSGHRNPRHTCNRGSTDNSLQLASKVNIETTHYVHAEALTVARRPANFVPRPPIRDDVQL